MDRNSAYISIYMFQSLLHICSGTPFDCAVHSSFNIPCLFPHYIVRIFVCTFWTRNMFWNLNLYTNKWPQKLVIWTYIFLKVCVFPEWFSLNSVTKKFSNQKNSIGWHLDMGTFSSRFFWYKVEKSLMPILAFSASYLFLTISKYPVLLNSRNSYLQ